MNAPARRPPAGPKPYWPIVTAEALRDDAMLVRVLAGMGFDDHLASTGRGGIVWWRPEYLRPPTRAHVAATYPARHADIRDACIDAWHTELRARVAPINRNIRDAEVWLMLDLPLRVTAIDTRSGEWTLPDRTQFGDDLISLGMVRWECSFGQAAGRIARLIGMRTIPTVQPTAPGDLFKGASLKPAAALPAEQVNA
ncbi:MAG: hypothetical protein K2X46_09970 [Roseomonas sp.]|nr:hypothetical protein [Roseomonas sp.]